MTTVLAIENEPDSGIRRLAPWLAEEDVEVRVVPGALRLPPTLDGVDGLILLGGGFMPDDDERAPWLAQERRLTEEALASGTPTLGICLGAQMIAQVAGGHVTHDYGAPERGSTPITRDAAASEDALFGDVPAQFRAIEHHRDAITGLPSGATLLAWSATCPVQAFRVGSRAWGVQFHPEVPADAVGQWDGARLAREGLDVQVLAEEAARHEPTTRAVCRSLARSFAGQAAARTRE